MSKNKIKPVRRSDNGQLRSVGGKVKVFIAAEIFPPAIGGPATYTVELANALAERSFQVRILCYGRPDKSVLNQNIKINWVSNRWPVLFKYIIYFKKLFWFSLNYQTIYAMGPVASGLPAMLVKKITGKKLIVKVVGDYAWEQAFGNNQTDLSIDEFQKNKKFGGKIGKLQKIEYMVCRKADQVIVPSKYLKDIVIGWGVEEKKINIIYNSFIQKHKGIKIQKQNNLTQILSVGRLVKWKGFDTLIKIMPELLKENPNFELIIGGEGPEEKNLKEMIQKEGLENNVKIIKMMNSQEVLMWLQQADIFVLNTGYEGLSHTILEAMSVSIPVITTNVGGNPELIKIYEKGKLVEYNNQQQLKKAILELYNEPKLREKSVENSKKFLEGFVFEKMINETIEIL